MLFATVLLMSLLSLNNIMVRWRTHQTKHVHDLSSNVEPGPVLSVHLLSRCVSKVAQYIFFWHRFCYTGFEPSNVTVN